MTHDRQTQAGMTGRYPVFHVVHPGHRHEERILPVPVRVQRIPLTLEAGQSLGDAMRGALEGRGFHSAVLSLKGGGFSPASYVIPAMSPTADRVAHYSARYEPPGFSALETGAMTVGLRNGKLFVHCHGLWTNADLGHHGGHMIPDDTIIGEPIEAVMWGCLGAAYVQAPDPETSFDLFSPEAVETEEEPSDDMLEGVVVQIRSNEDICHTIEDLCRRYGFKRASVHGGIGSLIGARFEDGNDVDRFATEIYVREGRVEPDADGEPVATLDIGLIDFKGGSRTGQLVRGRNPVLITCEVLLVKEA